MMTIIKTQDPDFTLRFAQPTEAQLVVDYMRKLGTYQKMRDKITAQASEVSQILAEGHGEAILGEYKGELVAFAYVYNNSSAFIGQRGLFIDGFYIDECVRFKGLGKIVFRFLANLAVQRGCQRLEWACLDWNDPSIQFYKEQGAYKVEDMSIYRLAPETLQTVAAKF